MTKPTIEAIATKWLDFSNLETGEPRWRLGTRHAGHIAGSRHPNGYVYIKMGGYNFKRARLVWAIQHGRWPQEIDHINRVKHDDRLANLREATSTQNKWNQQARSNQRGVQWRPDRRAYRAVIQVDRRRIHLGNFANITDAIQARHQAELKYFGEFRAV